MTGRRTLGMVLGLAFWLPTLVSAQEGRAEGTLVADLRTSVHSFKKNAVSPFDKVRLVMREEATRSPLVGPALWRLIPEAPAAPTLLPPASKRAPDRFPFVFQKAPSAARVAPLPPHLPRTAFPHGRVGGPFEQVYPRLW